jgi:hypothetical protein
MNAKTEKAKRVLIVIVLVISICAWIQFVGAILGLTL